MNIPSKTLVVMPAAGAGKRLQQGNFPKALTAIDERPLCTYSLDCLLGFDVAMVINPQHQALFMQKLSVQRRIRYFYQTQPTGMADAIAKTMPLWQHYDNILVLWSDLVWLTPGIVKNLLGEFEARHNISMLVPANKSDTPYVGLETDLHGRVQNVYEAREKQASSAANYADLGVFLFKSNLQRQYEDFLEDQDWGVGQETREKNFLPFLTYLHQQQRPANIMPIQQPVRHIGINHPNELHQFQQLMRKAA